MIDTRKMTRKIAVNNITVTVRPYWEEGEFGGYVASAYDTTVKYPIVFRRQFLHFGPWGNDEERTCREIAEDFERYYLPSTRIGD